MSKRQYPHFRSRKKGMKAEARWSVSNSVEKSRLSSHLKKGAPGGGEGKRHVKGRKRPHISTFVKTHYGYYFLKSYGAPKRDYFRINKKLIGRAVVVTIYSRAVRGGATRFFCNRNQKISNSWLSLQKYKLNLFMKVMKYEKKSITLLNFSFNLNTTHFRKIIPIGIKFRICKATVKKRNSKKQEIRKSLM